MAIIIFYQFSYRNQRRRILKNDSNKESPDEQYDENPIIKNSSYFKSAFETGIIKNTGYGNLIKYYDIVYLFI